MSDPLPDPIYLDFNATTPIHPRVADAMRPFLDREFGNPSSGHVYGRRAREAVERARAQVADLLGCAPEEILFTGGGTESNNLALRGVVKARGDAGQHLITTVVEHPAVERVMAHLERQGHRVTRVPVDATGQVDPDAVAAALEPETTLVSVMHANNEVGTVNPLPALAERLRDRDVLLHTDAAQSVGKIPTRVDTLGVDLLSVAGHKLYAPKGVGALYVRRGTPLAPVLHGADHERGLRPGTENLLGIVGLGEAAALAAETLSDHAAALTALRDRLHAAIRDGLPAGTVRLHGHVTERLPNTCNLGFRGVSAPALLEALPEVAASAGAACHSDADAPSSVLGAMGVSPDSARGAVRFSLGRGLTEADIDRAAVAVIRAARTLSP